MGSGVEDTCPTEGGTRTEKADEEISKLKQEVQEMRKELEIQITSAREYLDAARRIQAEFDNHRKRGQREREDFVKLANERLICDLLPIVDDLERALSTSCGPDGFVTGIRQIHNNLITLLKSYGLEEIPSVGKFDPQHHEALSTGEGEAGEILEVYQKGYFLGPRVLRHTKVKVGKTSGRGESNDENNRN